MVDPNDPRLEIFLQLGTSINSADHGAVRLLGVATRLMRP
jgi:hypothetical protein